LTLASRRSSLMPTECICMAMILFVRNGLYDPSAHARESSSGPLIKGL
jgi:hypothetical protein